MSVLPRASGAVRFTCRAEGGGFMTMDQVIGGLDDAPIRPVTPGRILLVDDEQAVFVLSCMSEVKNKGECLELGATHSLTKPFSLAELLARVRTQHRGEN